MSDFIELEQRIADLPDEKSRGDAFEVFAEAYLATQRKHDAEKVEAAMVAAALRAGAAVTHATHALSNDTNTD
ncbi:MAG TPA: hypothetical protein VEL06_10140 [Haliangiales bacterium]|nr:hypothetical protein [Haliangiales bacterium]